MMEMMLKTQMTMRKISRHRANQSRKTGKNVFKFQRKIFPSKLIKTRKCLRIKESRY